MREILVTMTKRGQLTVPAEVREHLGLDNEAKVVFVIDDAGTVRLQPPTYPDLQALCGAAGTLPRPYSDAEIDAIIAEERAEEYLRTLDRLGNHDEPPVS